MKKLQTKKLKDAKNNPQNDVPSEKEVVINTEDNVVPQNKRLRRVTTKQ